MRTADRSPPRRSASVAVVEAAQPSCVLGTTCARTLLRRDRDSISRSLRDRRRTEAVSAGRRASTAQLAQLPLELAEAVALSLDHRGRSLAGEVAVGEERPESRDRLLQAFRLRPSPRRRDG